MAQVLRLAFQRSFIALLGLCSSAQAANLQGRVLDSSTTPIAGAILTLSNANGLSISSYSDELGHWQLQAPNLNGELLLRARAPRFADISRQLQLSNEELQYFDLSLTPHASATAEALSLTASAHAATINWQDTETELAFKSQCLFCHQIGNAWTRKVLPPEAWQTIIRRMEGYGSLITGAEKDKIRDTLARSFQQLEQAKSQSGQAHAELAKARFTEWAFGGGINYVHDIELGADGRFYGVDMGADLLWIIDPASGQIEQRAFPPGELPLGGMFSGGVAPLGTFAAHRGPHSIIEGPEQRMYMTCSLSGEICIFDPHSGEFEFVPVGGDGIYPHTLRFDAQGVLWFTLALSNQIGRMDPAEGRVTLTQLPANGFWRRMTDVMLPAILKVSSWFGKRDLYLYLSHHKMSGQGYKIFNLPYGLDINPLDGSVWYSKLYADKIGRIDPLTLEVSEYETPFHGPRRLRFAADGTLWIPAFRDGVLMAFDSTRREFSANYPLPLLNPDEYEMPYALNVHPRTQEVWITGNMSDRILRFSPQTKRFVAYPSPTRTTFSRDVIFTPAGNVCTSNSNLPASAIEGGRPKIFCIEPDAYPAEIATVHTSGND